MSGYRTLDPPVAIGISTSSTWLFRLIDEETVPDGSAMALRESYVDRAAASRARASASRGARSTARCVASSSVSRTSPAPAGVCARAARTLVSAMTAAATLHVHLFVLIVTIVSPAQVDR